jgi:hypothetical protein
MSCTNRVLQTLATLNLRQAHHKSTTSLTYRNTASAPINGNVQMSSRMQASTGGISPPPLVSSLTGSGLRSLFLAIAISRGEAFLGQHSYGDSRAKVTRYIAHLLSRLEKNTVETTYQKPTREY